MLKITISNSGGMFDDPDASFTAGPSDARARRSGPKKQSKTPKRAAKVEAVEPAAPPQPAPEPGPAPVVPPVVIVEDEKPSLSKTLVAILDKCVEKVPTVVGPMTREAWLIAGVAQMTPLFEAKGYKVPPVRVSCGWPSIKGLSKKSRRIGECWAAEASADGVHQIFISPFLDQKVTPAAVLATLVHEVIHAVVGLEAKHGKKFKDCAKTMGLEGKMTATVAGPDLTASIGEWEKVLGPYPHASLDALKRPTKKQSTRMIKCECPDCGYVARTTKKWLDQSGAPLCACNKQPMKYEAPDEAGSPEESEDESED